MVAGTLPLAVAVSLALAAPGVACCSCTARCRIGGMRSAGLAERAGVLIREGRPEAALDLVLAWAESPASDAEPTLLAGRRHGCLHRAPELFADTVLDFLSAD